MKYFFCIFSSFVFLVSTAQNVPNGNFEEWEVRDHFKLDGWYSPTKNVERTADAKVGNYALKLSNTYSQNSNGTKGYVRNVDYNNNASLNGFAFEGDPLSLVFWSKHDLATDDFARIYIVFREQGTYRGKVDFRFTGSTNDEFVKYSVPIEWSGARTPDSLWVYLYSYSKNKVEGDGYVIFDDIHFTKINERQSGFTNSDFEDWSNIGVEFPSKWRSIDLLTYDTYTSFLANQSNFKLSGLDAFRGNHSLVIKNYNNNGTPRAGYNFIGTKNNQSYRRAFAVNDSFKYLQGYYKYTPDGDDTARILYRTWQDTRSRSYDNLYLTQANDWTFFTLPINYYSDATVPDSAALVAWSTSTDSIHGFNSALFLDELELVMEPTPLKLGVSATTFEPKIYPNPNTGKMHIEWQKPITEAWVTDLVGRNQKIEVIENSIDITHMEEGIYFLIINDGDSFSKPIKFIKE